MVSGEESISIMFGRIRRQRFSVNGFLGRRFLGSVVQSPHRVSSEPSALHPDNTKGKKTHR